MSLSVTWTLPKAERGLGVSVTRREAERDAVGEAKADANSPTGQPLCDLSEAALVEACLAGRAEAFDLLVERHRRPVYHLCYRFVGNHEDANDLSQDVFLRAYRGLRSFRAQSSLKTWLYRIGVNVCLNRVGTKRVPSEPIGDQQFIDVCAESPSERMLKDEQAARVRAAIAELPPKQRATLILRMYDELSHQEIADVLGSSVGAVKANFFHALANLKKLLLRDEVV
jgi:RNA polymerase sigma-70 factor (ECF subfamily)